MSEISTHQRYLQWKARAVRLRERFETNNEGEHIQDSDSFLADDWRLALEKMNELTTLLYKEHAAGKAYRYRPGRHRRGLWKKRQELKERNEQLVFR
jgi:hypothetical protein